jgi:hypothetical protein
VAEVAEGAEDRCRRRGRRMTDTKNGEERNDGKDKETEGV